MSVVSKKKSWVKQCSSPVIFFTSNMHLFAFLLPSVLKNFPGGTTNPFCWGYSHKYVWEMVRLRQSTEKECRHQDTHRTFLMLCMGHSIFSLLFLFRHWGKLKFLLLVKFFQRQMNSKLGEPGRAEPQICHMLILMRRHHLSSSSPMWDGNHEAPEGYHSIVRPLCFGLSVQTVQFCFWLACTASQFHSS